MCLCKSVFFWLEIEFDVFDLLSSWNILCEDMDMGYSSIKIFSK